ncbi:hypothetical protein CAUPRSCDRAFT_12913 [Caulochytrium protostelioides]|uniref:Uncharacterized protein n=1 Tax=Caulochytrium protostelioides TaxID=1555241 RepID=A0A4P9WVH7_9FUNG|nr:hypothetical protein CAUPRSCDRAFT_12913 [Caulochytrium protostelioides]
MALPSSTSAAFRSALPVPAETAKTLVLARLQKPDCLARGWFLTLDPVHVAVVRDTPELSGTSTLWVATHAPSAAVLAGLGADWIPRSRRGLDVNHDLDTPAITAKAVAERVMGALALCPVPQGV